MIDEAPLLDLSGGRITVDIAFLQEDDHRQAFVEIFSRVLRDNAALLEGGQLQHLTSELPIPGVPNLPLHLRDHGAWSPVVARALYDSGNERAGLELLVKGAPVKLNLQFDNPEFWLE